MNTQTPELTAELKEATLERLRKEKHPRIKRLTKREIIVLARLTPEATLATIAGELYVSRNTVKSQIRTAYKKLGTSKRADAITWVNNTVNWATL